MTPNQRGSNPSFVTAGKMHADAMNVPMGGLIMQVPHGGVTSFPEGR